MTKKVCLYCRVSTTDRQDVNRQVNELKEVVDISIDFLRNN